MKKLLFTLVLFISTTVLTYATNGQMAVCATTDNVKMYRQAGTSSVVVKALSRTDAVVVIRQHNANWTLVTVNNEAGYVVTSELTVRKIPRPLT